MRIQRFHRFNAARGRGALLFAAALGFAATPAIAQSGMISSQPPATPAHPSPPMPYPYPAYPVPSWAHPDEIRCEQDRLLTDTTPCGAETRQLEGIGRTSDGVIVSVPDRPRRCEQDRLLTDDRPCTR